MLGSDTRMIRRVIFAFLSLILSDHRLRCLVLLVTWLCRDDDECEGARHLAQRRADVVD